jgi:hypothetical protein
MACPGQKPAASVRIRIQRERDERLAGEEDILGSFQEELSRRNGKAGAFPSRGSLPLPLAKWIRALRSGRGGR